MISAEKPSFDTVVCGAGIAGLCAAIGLAQQGHNVTILDSAHELHPVGIGIHLPPNATLVLKYFGILDKVAPQAMYPSTFAMRRGDNNQVLGSTPESEGQSSGDGTPYWTIRRSDYQRLLYDAAVAAGCNVRLATRVTSIDVDAPSVTTDAGDIILTDLIVAADGIKSKLREMMIPEDNVTVVGSRFSSYRAYISEEDLMSDPVTEPSFKDHPTNIWIGCNRHIIAYPCGGGLFTFSGIYPAESNETTVWNQSAKLEEVQKEYEIWHNPVVDRVIAHTKDIKNWRLGETPVLPRWTSKSGKAVLIGDAAHAMYPTLAQGAAMATEDALALSMCIGRAKSTDDLPAVTKAFERSRKWRCEIMQAQSRRSNEVLHIADGIEQEERDKKMGGLSCDESFWEVDVGPLMEPRFQGFLFGHDVKEHTKKILASMSL